MMVRFNPDGTLDGSFNYQFNNTISALAFQPDWKILAGGFGGGLSRLHNDGTIDTIFNVGAGANNTVNSIALQSDLKMLIGGVFTEYNGTARNRVARVNGDGANSLLCGQDNEKIKVCINGNNTVCLIQQAANNLVQHNPKAQFGECGQSSKLGAEENGETEIVMYPNPTTGMLTVVTTNPIGTLRILDITGRVVHEMAVDDRMVVLDVSNLSQGMYLIETATHRMKVIKQ